jgi:hypothetical protein
VTAFVLLLLGLFVLPVVVCGCLPDGREGIPWYQARRDPTGLAPDPVTTPEAVIQVYAARAVSWRGKFAVRQADGGPSVIRGTRCSVSASPTAPRPQVVFDRRGEGVDAMIDKMRAAVASYPSPVVSQSDCNSD